MHATHPSNRLTILLGILLLPLAGCGQSGSIAAQVPKQAQTCLIRDPDVDVSLLQCKEGDVLAFLPPTFGNEQLPIIVAATRCDFRHPIVWNTGGLTCIYTARRIAKETPDPQQSGSPSSRNGG